ncbi:HNH endonuclease [Halorubrum sp. BOL3-1]|uniref:HNH endonuclease signature motif containing protein n=1 Tax=Halorubrum sp. BOL3-1 TaxID=2497325 RepID=UPI001004FA04|nr:HNH endonuclease signature motif containing protein [Halorubrum sp. BOL3-1]QAU13471.1 HNH endonuclease [Halorubrum sp. BOL3-1]
MSDDSFRQAVRAAWGGECLVCGRSPEGWLNTTEGARRQDKLSLHHINGDDTDNRVANVIPLCQSCHVHIHKVDEPPYRQWHRQLPIEHRNAWNAHYKEYYEGPRLDSSQAEWFFGDDEGTPESVKYRRHEPTEPDTDSTPAVDGSMSATPEDTDDSERHDVADRTGEDADVPTARRGVDPNLDPEAVSIEYTPNSGDRRRIRFIDRDDGPGWWQVEEAWTGQQWRPVGREPVTGVDVTIY